MSLSGARVVVMALLLAMALIIVAPYGASAITCIDVDTKLYPCLSYIQGSGGSVPASCCSGLRGLVTEATTKTDRQTVCSCLESVASGASKQEWAVASGIPAKCGVKVPFKISSSTDCSKIN